MHKSSIAYKHLYLKEGLVIGRLLEYDGKEAGWNLIKSNNLVHPVLINYLSTLTKHQRTIEIGRYRKIDKEFSKLFSDAMRETVASFIHSNRIEDDEIVSIRNDSVTFKYKTTLVETTVNGVEFRIKGSFSSYVRIGKIDAYFNSSKNELLVKGITDFVSNYPELANLLKRVMFLLEKKDFINSFREISKFSNKYRSYEADISSYRKLLGRCMYTYKSPITLASDKMESIDFLGDNIEELDISYNYFFFVLPLYRMIFELI
jgi:hypothetical protein